MDHVWYHIMIIYGTMNGLHMAPHAVLISYMAQIWYHIWFTYGTLCASLWGHVYGHSEFDPYAILGSLLPYYLLSSDHIYIYMRHIIVKIYMRAIIDTDDI